MLMEQVRSVLSTAPLASLIETVSEAASLASSTPPAMPPEVRTKVGGLLAPR
mgnify:CR=1 FL=1